MKSLTTLCILVLFFWNSNLGATSKTQTWTVENTTVQNLGTVTLVYTSGSQSLTVSGTGNYSAIVPSAITAVTINGQTVSSPTASKVTLPNGITVHVTWPSPNVIQLGNPGETQSPIRL